MGIFSRTHNGLELDVVAANGLLTEGSATLVDVREGWEWSQGRASGARHIPLGKLAGALNNLPRDKQVLVICASGNRSLSAAQFLQQQGFDAKSVKGGTSAWARAGLPIQL